MSVRCNYHADYRRCRFMGEDVLYHVTSLLKRAREDFSEDKDEKIRTNQLFHKILLRCIVLFRSEDASFFMDWT